MSIESRWLSPVVETIPQPKNVREIGRLVIRERLICPGRTENTERFERARACVSFVSTCHAFGREK